MEYINCDLCGSNRSRLLFRKADIVYDTSKDLFNVVKCLSCGLIYVNPRPNEEEIKSFYTKEYYNVDLTVQELLKEKEDSLIAKFEKVKHIMPGRLLDIGCMKGEYLYFMQQKGWKVKGIDFSPTPPNLFGLDIFYGRLEEARLPSQHFDLVTMWAVLEHVYYPRKMLNEIHRLLKPGGTLVLLVTNINSIPGRLFQEDEIPRHTTLFSKRTISKLLKSVGFKISSFHFGNDIFRNSHRGLLNFLVKSIVGEDFDSIVVQFHNSDWWDFACELRGRDSKIIRRIDELDKKVAPYLDHILNKIGFGFNMTVEATKI